jgi:short-subunit dehydrogenase
MASWIILGATSSMARALARKCAENGDRVIVAGRDMDDLKSLATDLEARGAEMGEAVKFDATDAKSFAPLLKKAELEPGELNVAVFVGNMPSQEEIDADPALIDSVVTTNYAGPARFLTEIAPLLEARAGGTIVGIASVAGDRGRVGNYVYGSAKAGFATYLAGLRNRLTRAGAHVVTVKPGFVDTSMTWGIQGMFLVASPDKVAGDILKAVEKQKNVIYTPSFWWLIMTIIKLVPERIFKKLSI